MRGMEINSATKNFVKHTNAWPEDLNEMKTEGVFTIFAYSPILNFPGSKYQGFQDGSLLKVWITGNGLFQELTEGGWNLGKKNKYLRRCDLRVDEWSDWQEILTSDPDPSLTE